MTYDFLLSFSYESIIENILSALSYNSGLKPYNLVRKKQHPQMLPLTLNLTNRQSIDKEQGKAE